VVAASGSADNRVAWTGPSGVLASHLTAELLRRGPQPRVSESSACLASIAASQTGGVPNGYMSLVDVRDAAELHVRVNENDAASGALAAALANGAGRYASVSRSVSWKDAVAALKAALPEDLAARVPVFEGDVSGTASEYDTAPATGQPWHEVAHLGRAHGRPREL